MRIDKRLANYVKLHKIKSSFVVLFVGLGYWYGFYPCRRA